MLTVFGILLMFQVLEAKEVLDSSLPLLKFANCATIIGNYLPILTVLTF